MKKGLVIVYDPHSLLQFLWYYYTYGKNKKWDALCLPNENKKTYMHLSCTKVGLFEKVIKGDINYLNMSLWEKSILFIKMAGYYIIGRKKTFARKVINEYVNDVDNYDECISICETGFITGLSTLLNDIWKVSFLDDGLGEYCKRSIFSNHYKKTSFAFWQSFLICRMGYGCKGRFYFDPTKYCYKYSAITSEMQYCNYKEMQDIDFTNTDMKGYNSAIKKLYPEINSIPFDDIEAIFFSDDMDQFSDTCRDYYDKCTNYISDRYKTVLLKKHPADTTEYNFAPNIRVIEVDSSIPAEVLLPFIKNQDIYFSMFSSIIIFSQQYSYRYKIFYSEVFYNDNVSSNKYDIKFHSRDEMRLLCERFSKEKYNIIDL